MSPRRGLSGIVAPAWGNSANPPEAGTLHPQAEIALPTVYKVSQPSLSQVHTLGR